MMNCFNIKGDPNDPFDHGQFGLAKEFESRSLKAVSSEHVAPATYLSSSGLSLMSQAK
jgi:hypothetical protein